MRELDAEIGSSGIAVRFVTIGSQRKAEEYCGRHNPAAICIGDADKSTYKAMGMTDFDLTKLTSTPELVERRNENQAAGFRQDWAATRIWDAAQNPGAAVLDADGVVRFVHRGRHPGDLPPLRELFERAQTVLGAPQ